MVAPDLILAAMLSLPRSDLDKGETDEQRRALYLPVATAIAEVAKNDRQAALLVAQAWEESRNARYVFEHRCQDGPRGARCDDLRSTGPFQVSVRYCNPSSYQDEARCAMKAAWGGAQRCGKHSQSPAHSWFVGMAGSRVPCSWSGAAPRVATYKRVLERLRRGAPEEVAKR